MPTGICQRIHTDYFHPYPEEIVVATAPWHITKSTGNDVMRWHEEVDGTTPKAQLFGTTGQGEKCRLWLVGCPKRAPTWVSLKRQLVSLRPWSFHTWPWLCLSTNRLILTKRRTHLSTKTNQICAEMFEGFPSNPKFRVDRSTSMGCGYFIPEHCWSPALQLSQEAELAWDHFGAGVARESMGI